MKKFFKIFFIVLGSLLVLILAALGIAYWYVFTPEKLTPIVRKQAERYINCQTEIGSVELTLFSTFPRLGIKINDVKLINPVPNAPSDTLLSIERLFGYIDVDALRKENELLLSEFSLLNGNINVFIDADGRTNFDIFDIESDPDVEPDGEFPLDFIDIGNIKVENIHLSYVDEVMKINTSVRGLDAAISGVMHPDHLNSVINIMRGNVFLAYDDEVYLPHTDVRLLLPADFSFPEQKLSFADTRVVLDEMDFTLNGYIQLEPNDGRLLMDVDYVTNNPLAIKSIMAYIPASFEKYFEGMEADGLLTSSGKVTGLPPGSNMPILDLTLEVEDGSFAYTYLPLPLRRINGKMQLYTDLQSDGTSYLQINRMNARTPASSFSTRGRLDNLFSDIGFQLNTDARLSLNELSSLVPDTMNLDMKGNLQGRVRSAFTMSQLELFQVDKMKLSGQMTTDGLDIVFDSLWVKTGPSDIEFALPNPFATIHDAAFVFANILSDRIEAGDPAMEKVLLDNAQIMLELSDLRYTTRIPDILCSFKFDHLLVEMDTLLLSIEMPAGSASLHPQPGKPDHPDIMMAYNSGRLLAKMGAETLELESVHLDTEVLNDQSQEDVFLQWLVTGFIDIDNGSINTTAIPYPIIIPAIKMDFDPERLDIRDSRITLGNSDFELKGILNNILSYFRGDTILQGEFLFNSNNTDILQLMSLTSGIGVEEETLAAEQHSQAEYHSEEETDEILPEKGHTGPYMVPEGIDILLTSTIKQATFGTDTATNIVGDVRISDGILLLDELSFVTPAARMQLTAMYRTPRKNHLFLGLDYHMLDIEIERLLQMIPEIDSIMPMLRSFRGEGAFHFAIESYLDSTYTLKMSTLRGAASITGQNLVLMDGETFSEIASTLRFSKRAENMVDSLSAEFTIFREEIDVYPFLIVMDRYKAVVGGRHNLDMSFNYHISLVESPLPVRLGIDVRGDLENMSYSLARPRYAEFYRPAARGVVASRQLELRQLIRESLLERLNQ